MPESDRQLRDRHAELLDAVDRIDEPGDGSTSEVVTTTSIATYPTVAGAYYAVSSNRLDGAETEGAAATLAGGPGGKFLAYNLGTAVPPAGTPVIVHSAGGRWVFRYDG